VARGRNRNGLSKVVAIESPKAQVPDGEAPVPESETQAADPLEPEAAPRPRRGRPRQGKAVARDLPRDEELLQIAAEVFFRQGFDGTKLDDIARQAGIVKGSLYHYFSSKDEIYERLVKNVRTTLNLEEEVHKDGPAIERLEHLLRSRMSQTAEYPLEVGLLSRQMVQMEGPIGDWAREIPRSYFNAVRRVIVQGQKEGLLRPVDPDVIAAMILGVLNSICQWYRPGGRVAADELVDELTEFILTGLRVSPRS